MTASEHERLLARLERSETALNLARDLLKQTQTRLKQVEHREQRNLERAYEAEGALRAAEVRVQELEARVVELVEGHDLERHSKRNDELEAALREIEGCGSLMGAIRTARRALAPDTAEESNALS